MSMPIRPLVTSLRSRLLPLLKPVLTALLASSFAHAQQPVTIAGTTAVGSSATPQSVSLTLTQGGTVSAIRVLTLGSPNYDFTAASGAASGSPCTTGSSYLAGQQCSVLVGFKPTYPGVRVGAVVLLDANNNPLATQTLSGNATGAVATFVPGTINTIAGDTAWIYSGDGMPAIQSSIFLPFGFAIDAAGDVFIADSSNNRIRRVDAATGLISTVAGNGLIGSSGNGGLGTSAALSNPSSLALDPAGNLYIADSGNNMIRRLDAFTGIITAVAGTAGLHTYSGDNGPATSAGLNTPNGIALDSNGNLFIADTGNNVIRKVSLSTGVITTVAGNGTANFSGDQGQATSATLYNPWSVTVDQAGELYIADQNNNRIRKVSTTGIISTIAGNGIPGFTGDAGPANVAELNVPASVAIDVAGNLYIADSGNNRVRKISAQTGQINTIAGNGGQSFAGDGGPADQSGLYGPYTLALDGQGSLYIADVFHNRVRKDTANAGTLLFAPMRVGRVSAPLTQTIENDGNAPLTPSSILTISNSQLDAVNTTCSTNPLAPLASCIISTSFAPTSIGTIITGEVNVTSNAANAPSIITLEGEVLDTDPTTVTVSSSSNPSTINTPVTFTVEATSSGTVPTGTITLLDGSVVLASGSLDKTGKVTFTFSNLTAGSHSITADYNGDSSNAAGDSSELTQLVNETKAPTVTLLALSASPLNAGATLQLTATVAVATPGSGTGAIAGSVTFTNNGTTLGTAAVNASGIASLSVSTLTIGNHTLSATYAGNTAYATSTSANVTETVNLAQTHMVVASSANPSNSGAPLTLTATIFSNGGVPTGNIIFLDNGKLLGSAPINAQGIANLPVAGSNWTVGTHTLTATYVGDTNDGSCAAPGVSQVVNLATATLKLVSSVNPSPLSGSLTFTATASSNGGMPTGTIQFLDGTTSIGSGTLNGSGNATFTTTSLILGSHTITASYGGDTYDSTASSTTLTQVINPTTTTVTLTPSANPSMLNAQLTLSISVSATGAQPTGTVLLTDSGATIATLSLDANGNASLTTSTLTIGTHTLQAAYVGDASHSATTSAVLTEHVVQSTATALALGASQVIAGLQATFTCSVTGSNGKAVTGSIMLMDGARAIATLTPDANGSATYTTATLSPGSHTIIANYQGDTTSAASSSSPALQTITVAATTTTLTSSANPAFTNIPLTLNASVTGNGATPTGSIVFADGATVLATVPLTNGAAAYTTSTLTAGIHQIIATYSGDTNDGISKSATLSQQIAQQTAIVISSSANPSLLTDNVTITISVNNGATVAPTGSITLTDNGSVVATPALDGTGHASFLMSSPALGKHVLVATYAGDSQNIPGTSPAFTQTVTLRPTTTTLTSSSINLSAGQQLIFISIVQGSGPTAPTGTVSFQSGSTTLGSVPVTAGGVATLSLDPSQANLNVVAVYSGDSLYSTSTSKAVAIVVGPPIEFTVSAPGTMTLASGDHNTMTITIATAPTFVDTINFGCAGLPQYATCTFTTDSMAITGGVTKTLSVVVDTGNPLGAGAQSRLNSPPGQANQLSPLACLLPAALLLGFIGRKRIPVKLLILFIGLAAVTSLSGCASNFQQGKTVAGSYTFQIVATGAKTGATGTAPVLLTVSQ